MSEPNHLYHQALSSNRKLLAENERLKAELTNRKAEADRLKAEVERLRASSFVTAVPVEEYEKLKAEVERLTAELSNISAWGRGLESDLSHARVEISFLKAEVERLTEDNRQLTKAFEIAEGIIKRMGKAAEDAAKEGKPSV